MSRVLLVNSPSRKSEPPRHYPYGLAILSRILEQNGHSVAAFDGNFSSLDELACLLDLEQYDLIGISGLVTTFQFQRAAAAIARRHGREAVIASGGGLATAVGEELLTLIPDLDLVFIGEAELDLPKLLNTLDSAPSPMPAHASSALRTLTGNPVDQLDTIPLPQLRPWRVARYFTQGSFPLSPFSASAKRRANVLSSRGCPFECDFCFGVHGRRNVRYRSPDNVLMEIEHLVREYQIDFISFLDESFLIDKRRVHQIAEGIQRKGWRIHWGIAARSTSVDAELLGVIKAAGCDFIYYGFDSGSPDTLRRMNKRMTADDNFEAFRLTVEAGIYPVPNIIIGYDNETPAHIDENYKFLNRLIRYGSILTDHETKRVFERGFHNFGAIYFATPYPGSALFARNRDRLPPLSKILERISGKDAYELTVNVSSMSDETLRAEQRKMEAFVRGLRL